MNSPRAVVARLPWGTLLAAFCSRLNGGSVILIPTEVTKTCRSPFAAFDAGAVAGHCVFHALAKTNLITSASDRAIQQYPVIDMKTHPCRRAAVFGMVAVSMLAAWPAAAGVVARIDQGQQRMRVFVDGRATYDWPVSTARRGFVTPNGRYRVGRMATMWRSRKYHGAPMPHAMFFRGGYAIHGTYATGSLGRRASHGCVRLSPGHAARLFDLARTYGGAAVELRN